MNFKNLSAREKLILAALAVMLVFGAYMRMIHMVFSKSKEAQLTRIKKYNTQIKELNSKLPALDEQKARIDSLNKDCERMTEEVNKIEMKMPLRKDTSQLIGEFTRLANRAKLISIRQKVATQEGYNRILIEVTLNASYPEAIYYISRIESISPFLRVEEVDINDSKGKSAEEGGAPVRLVVSSLLGDTAPDNVLKASEEELKPVKRDILISKTKPVEKLNEKDFKLEGITYNSIMPTAILNGEVFRVGAEIKGLKVKQILPDQVVLTDGSHDHVMNLNGHGPAGERG